MAIISAQPANDCKQRAHTLHPLTPRLAYITITAAAAAAGHQVIQQCNSAMESR